MHKRKRKMIGLAAATAVLGGLGSYGAASAFAATSPPDPRTSTTQSSETGGRVDGHGSQEEMIRHCTEQLPADDRAEARQQMERMMSGGMMSGSMMGDSMMGGASHDGHHGMG